MHKWIVALVLLALGSAAHASPTGLRVAIYSGTGAESDKTLALYRAVASAGHTPQAIVRADVVGGRLTTARFDVLILPAGEGGKRCCAGHYSDDGDALGSIAAQEAIRSFLASGGGLVAIEAGAFFACMNGGTLDVYPADYHNVTDQVGKRTLTLSDPSFGAGTLESWNSSGGGSFDTTTACTVVARNASGQPVIVRASYSAGRVVLSSMDLELRGDSDLDWTSWDNWAMGSHANSAANWELLGRMIGWAYDGDPSPPTITPAPVPPGARIAVVSSHTSDGGAWPGLLPAVGRTVEHAGHIPLALRFEDITSGRLTNGDFDAVVFPGGYSYGYKTGLAGSEGALRSYVSAGGGYLGICAGGFYASRTLDWDGKSYTYPLDLFPGTDSGPLGDIAPWPGYALTPTRVSDPVAGGTYDLVQTYYGGGHFILPGGDPYTPSVTYAYSGQYSGTINVVRFPYGAGHVVLTGTHPESRAGSTEDWLFWDGYDLEGQPLVNPDDPWRLMDALLNNWLVSGQTTAVGATGPAPTGTRLLAAPVPNPSVDAVRLAFRVDGPRRVRLTVHDLAGRTIVVLADGPVEAGEHRFLWATGSGASRATPSGVYFVRLESGRDVESRKLVLLESR
jgi:glutamine amidotransferase-like uncharacterized protein